MQRHLTTAGPVGFELLPINRQILVCVVLPTAAQRHHRRFLGCVAAISLNSFSLAKDGTIS